MIKFHLIIYIHLIFSFSAYCQVTETKIEYPYIDKDACPFEGCKYGNWLANSEMKVYQSEGDTTKVIHYLKSNEQFFAQTGNVHIIKPGVVLIKKKIYNYTVNDTIFVLTYLGEGWYKIYDGDKIFKSDYFWEVSDNENINLDNSKYSGVMISNIKMVWWVSILFGVNKQ